MPPHVAAAAKERLDAISPKLEELSALVRTAARARVTLTHYDARGAEEMARMRLEVLQRRCEFVNEWHPAADVKWDPTDEAEFDATLVVVANASSDAAKPTSKTSTTQYPSARAPHTV